jgi:TolB-like protein/DNA-binding winged helix-turn-helix (wHTH) protein/Tfp pilus assembly protein PilF
METSPKHFYQFGPFVLDAAERTLAHAGALIPLTPKAFDILLVLVRHSGHTVEKQQLFEEVWPGTFVEDGNLAVNVFALRKALGTAEDGHEYIETLPKRGYRFTAEVKQTVGLRVDLDVPPLPISEVVSKPRSVKKLAGIALLGLGMLALAAVAAFIVRSRAQPSGGRLMLAVLPFENLTGDAGQEYFSDGLTEEMIAQVGRFDPQRIGVIARTSVMHYKHTQEPLGQIAAELGVQYVLEGSVRRDPDKVRISAQLIQVKDQTHLWARQYDRELSSILTLQGEIAQEITDEIQLTLGTHKQVNPIVQPALSPQALEAYDLYLKGQFFWNKRTVQGFRQAIEYFQQAIAKDPHSARAYAGLSDCYTLLGGYSMVPQSAFMVKARAAALKALQIDDTLAEAHTALALIVQNYDWDWQTSEKEFRRAIELNPNYATAHHWYAEHLTWLGRFDEAFRESEEARRLDPLSVIIAVDNGAILYFSRQYDRAIEKFRAVREMEPNVPRISILLSAYVEKGLFAEALAEIERGLRTWGDGAWRWSSLANVYGRSGQQAKAKQALAKLEEWNQRQELDAAAFAGAYLALGNKDQAFVWLEKAYVQHSNLLVTLRVEPSYNSVRTDPRFRDLLQRVGLAQ